MNRSDLDGDRSGVISPDHWEKAQNQLRAASAILSTTAQTDARSVPASIVLEALHDVHERLRVAADHLRRAIDDDRHQG